MSAPQPTYTPGQRHVIALAPGVELAFRYIPPTGPRGFRMGSRGNKPAEEPVHRVVIACGFWLGETVVTQAQFAVWTSAVGETHKNHFKGKPNHPAESLEWWQAARFCDWLTREFAPGNPGRKFPEGVNLACLPTEAEWEYACRAGTDTDYHNGDGEAALAEVGWYEDNGGGETHEVTADVAGRPEAHPWKLRGMHGNVWEWCHDLWGEEWDRPRPIYRGVVEGEVDIGATERAADCQGGIEALLTDRQHRVLRGGSWVCSASICRSASRNWWQPGVRFGDLGFRVCLAPSPAIAEASADKTAEPTKTEKEQAEVAGGGGRRRPGRPESSAPDAAGAADKGAGHDLARERIRPPQAAEKSKRRPRKR